MARRKTPVGETDHESAVRKMLEAIADNATRSEKVSWERKMDNMIALITTLNPIEDQILDLMAAKQPIIDAVAELRRDMVKDCVHPFNMLVDLEDGSARCSFCDGRFSVVKPIGKPDL